MRSYKQLLVLLLGILEAYWSKLYKHKKKERQTYEYFWIKPSKVQSHKLKRYREMISLAWKTDLKSISSVYGYWLLCSVTKVVTKNIALLWFYICFFLSILSKHRKVPASLAKGVKISIYVSYHAHCIKLSHAGFIYK